MSPAKPTLTSKATQALQGRGRRSSLYWWMRDNYAEIKTTKGQNRTDWKSFVAELTRLGLTDINNKPPNLETAQRTWYRVAKDMATKPEPIPEPIPTPTPILPTPTIPKRILDARPTPTDNRAKYDPLLREGEAENLLGNVGQPKRR